MATGTAPSPAPRVRLSRERVLQGAVELADDQGIGALTIRALAERLGVKPMSLYNHVANKEDILDGVIDLVLAEVDIPTAGEDWKAAMRRRATSVREMLSRHPWAAGLVESRTTPSPMRLRYHDAVLGSLREAGFSNAMATHAFSTLHSYIYGFSLQESSLPFGDSDEMAEVASQLIDFIPSETYPYLSENVRHALETGFDFRQEFEFGLDLILDGFERLLGEGGSADPT